MGDPGPQGRDGSPAPMPTDWTGEIASLRNRVSGLEQSDVTAYDRIEVLEQKGETHDGQIADLSTRVGDTQEGAKVMRREVNLLNQGTEDYFAQYALRDYRGPWAALPWLQSYQAGQVAIAALERDHAIDRKIIAALKAMPKTPLVRTAFLDSIATHITGMDDREAHELVNSQSQKILKFCRIPR
jgi:hypothetical protein